MKVVIGNEEILIYNAPERFEAALTERLTYKDKSVEYQMRKMKSPFQKKSNYYKQLEKQLHGTLVKYNDDSISIPSGFSHLIPDYAEIVDKRKDTGPTIPLPWQQRPFDPRDYQEEALHSMESCFRGVVNMATGLGKTLIAIHAVKRFKRKSLIVCPSTSIADNFYTELCNAFGDHRIGYFGNGKKKINDVTVAVAASVKNHIEKFKKEDLGLILFDEVHHLAANTFYSISEGLSSVGRIYGLTATNFRADGKDVMIEAGVGPAIIQRDLIWGIEKGWLADPFIIVREVHTSGKDYQGDKVKNYKAHVLQCGAITNRVVQDANAFMSKDRSVLVLVSEVSHGAEIAEQLGIPLATGKDKKSNSYVEDLNSGCIPGLVGTAQFIGEGTDTKNVDVLILANMTASKGTLWQNLGRGLRIHGDSTKVIVLDYVPLGSKMLTRHAQQRIKSYKEITANVKIVY